MFEMRSSYRLIAVTTLITAASAYINQPCFFAKRVLVCDSWSSKLELSTRNDSFEEMRDSIRSPLLRAQSVTKFCFEIGCTIQAYQGTIEKLRRRKKDLSNQMNQVEDELGRLRQGEEIHNAIPEFLNSVGIQEVSSSLWSSLSKSLLGQEELGLPKQSKESHYAIPEFLKSDGFQQLSSSWWSSISESLQGTEETNPYASDLHSESHAVSVSILRERRKKLSDRALAIQNLLATLEVIEYSGMTTTKELADTYRTVAEAERINIFATGKPGLKASSFPAYNSAGALRGQPQPPHPPPTVKQFMVR